MAPLNGFRPLAPSCKFWMGATQTGTEAPIDTALAIVASLLLQPRGPKKERRRGQIRFVESLIEDKEDHQYKECHDIVQEGDTDPAMWRPLHTTSQAPPRLCKRAQNRDG